MASRPNRRFRRQQTVVIPDPGFFEATWTVNSTGYITMGLIASEGDIPAGSGVQVGAFTTQTDVLNTWADGSLRHAAVSFNATSTGAKALTVISNPGGSYSPTWPTATVVFETTGGSGSGNTYTATLPAFDGTNTVCNGAVCRRSWVLVTPTTAGAVEHPVIQVKFEVTSYNGSGHIVSITIQNIKNISTVDKTIANVTTTVNGSGFAGLTKAAWTIYTGTRWHRRTTVSLTEAVVLHDFEPWIAANVIPRIPNTIDTKVYDLNAESYQLGGATSGIIIFGECDGGQGNSENADRQELNPWTDWEARLFALNTEHYRQTILANANQSGGWSWQICKATDGQTLLKITEDGNDALIVTDIAAGQGGYSGLQWPEYADLGDPDEGAWKGTYDGAASVGDRVHVDREHLVELNFVPYLLTCDTFYLDQLRFIGSWSVFIASGTYTEPEPYLWSGFSVGRHGTLGELNNSGMSREFGRPLKMVARAAWALPTTAAYSADQAYFHTIVANNLTAVARYIDYHISRGWGGSWGQYILLYGASAWGYSRNNTVSSTTGASPTVLTVIGDDSGIGTGTNDHAMQTGDFVDLSGFTGGASGLNGHRAITRLSATTFSVAVDTTGSPTSGVGAWSTYKGVKVPTWRLSVGSREVSWIGFTGLWTMTSSMWAFPDRIYYMEEAVQDNPTYLTAPGVSHNFYPSPVTIAADAFTFFENWTDLEAHNNPTSSTAALMDSEYFYTAFGSTSHRGNIQAWGNAWPNTYYTPYAMVNINHGVKRGLTGAVAARAKLKAAAEVLNELERRPGFYHED